MSPRFPIADETHRHDRHTECVRDDLHRRASVFSHCSNLQNRGFVDLRSSVARPVYLDAESCARGVLLVVAGSHKLQVRHCVVSFVPVLVVVLPILRDLSNECSSDKRVDSNQFGRSQGTVRHVLSDSNTQIAEMGSFAGTRVNAFKDSAVHVAHVAKRTHFVAREPRNYAPFFCCHSSIVYN